mgnify:CR=1 FL=1
MTGEWGILPTGVSSGAFFRESGFVMGMAARRQGSNTFDGRRRCGKSAEGTGIFRLNMPRIELPEGTCKPGRSDCGLGS